jgi:hypothetical protein
VVPFDRSGVASILCCLCTAACGDVMLNSPGAPDARPGAPGTVPDAMTDAAPDAESTDAAASACFGTTLLHVCLASPPTQPFAISSFTLIDTASTTACAPLVSGGDYCVIAATTMTITGTLRATGRRPLVLIASESITATALIDVGSHRAATPEVGAGAEPPSCAVGTLPITLGGTNGGGAGGSFLRAGGRGGDGTNAAGSGGTAGAAVAASRVTSLRGGCAGQPGDGIAKTPGGHGGGAVFLIAGNAISVSGSGGINAAGEGGGGAAPMARGGGGGGAGGMIGFDAPAITVSSLILANGGGGGEASSDTNLGNPGADPSAVRAAAGGTGGNTNGGDGGAGAGGNPTTAAGAGGGGGGTTDLGGGGGGGGGTGLILAPATAVLGTLVSPPAVH